MPIATNSDPISAFLWKGAKGKTVLFTRKEQVFPSQTLPFPVKVTTGDFYFIFLSNFLFSKKGDAGSLSGLELIGVSFASAWETQVYNMLRCRPEKRSYSLPQLIVRWRTANPAHLSAFLRKGEAVLLLICTCPTYHKYIICLHITQLPNNSAPP